jgi:hypothetical protein
MSSNCCDSSYYRTPFNIKYQDMYCNLAQKVDTDLKKVITSGWSYGRLATTEGYCNCNSRLVNTPMQTQGMECSVPKMPKGW